MSDKELVSIFWTGGYDSTFRVCQLSRKEVVIQPYYMSDNRPSEANELDAIAKISYKLINNPDTVAEIRPLIIIPKNERQHDDKIKNAFYSLLKLDFMGAQYEWLGCFSRDHEGIEMSIHKDDKAVELIKKHGSLKAVHDKYGDYYVIDKENSSEQVIELFGNSRFPLADYTKLQMKEEYESMGLADIIEDTWFCLTPVDGKPCGCCNPCVYTIEEGMSYRFSEEALARYKKHQNPINKAMRNIKRKIKVMTIDAN